MSPQHHHQLSSSPSSSITSPLNKPPCRKGRSTNYNPHLHTYSTLASIPNLSPFLPYNNNLLFVAPAPAVLIVVVLNPVFAAATLDDRGSIELTADDAADDAAALAMEVASGRTGMEEKVSGGREDSWSWAVARKGRRVRTIKNEERIFWELWVA